MNLGIFEILVKQFGGFSDLGMLIKPKSVRQSSLSRFWLVGGFFSRKSTFLDLLASFMWFRDFIFCDIGHCWDSGKNVGGFCDLGMLIKPNSVRQSSLSRFWPAGGFFFRKNTFLEMWTSFRWNPDCLKSKKTRNLTRSWVHQFSARNVWYGPIWWQSELPLT